MRLNAALLALVMLATVAPGCGSGTLLQRVGGCSSHLQGGPTGPSEAASDPKTGNVLAFSESDGRQPARAWLLDRDGWRTLGAAPEMDDVHLTFDEATGEAVLIGHGIQSGRFETWTWRGAGFIATGAGDPTQRTGISGLAYDSQRRHVVLAIPAPQPFFEWTGASWQPRPSQYLVSAQPDFLERNPARGLIGFAYSKPTNGNGFDVTGALYQPAGGGWQALNVSGTPGFSSGRAYDPDRHDLVVIGSAKRPLPDAGGHNAATYVFDGSRWFQHSLPSQLLDRGYYTIGWSQRMCGVVLQGGVQMMGFTQAKPRVYSDTWLWDGSTWTELSS